MTTVDLEHLKSIQTFPELIAYLRDELDWPIRNDSIDDLTFDYEPEELGIDPRNKVKISAIKQLRPLVTDQPWGIFFIEFEPKRLPVVALRRILRGLVIKKRQSADRSHQATWQLHDLMFISSYGESEHRSISFAHFSEDPEVGDLPVLRVLGWDDRDTLLHLGHAHETLKQKLHWPEDEDDLETWREHWGSAFTIRHREVITTSKALSVRLAALGRRIRNRTNEVIAIESEDGPLRKLFAGFKEALIHDLEEDDFADMYAQTIAYGLLTARVSRPAGLVADNLSDMVPVTNPFLKELLQTFLSVGGRRNVIDFDELGVNDVVDLLRVVNMEAVLRDFGDRASEEDPVIHFYELFLKEYDPEKRIKRGVFYTPRPVVSFIVRSVNEILINEFGLQDGLADIRTWGEMKERNPEIEIPEGVSPEESFVKILDPAVGTGTFLVEAIDVIYNTMLSKWEEKGRIPLEIPNLWNEYVSRNLLPRLYGYELMMAPYAIAHMKIGLKLAETGYLFQAEERANIYLTNSLEPPQDFSDRLAFDVPALAHEAQTVNAIKRDQRFTVVIGNPPYSGISSNMAPWIDGLLKGTLPDGSSTASYYHVDGQPLGERKLWLQDDYVKFIRWSQYCLQNTGVGIHAFITNHGYLDNTTFRGMRWSLMDAFDDIRVLDLHGNTKKQEIPPEGGRDANVFDIQQGVGIGLFVRQPVHQSGIDDSAVYHADLWGDRDTKYEWLLNHSIGSADVQKVDVAEPFYLFEPFDQSEGGNYYDWPAIKDVLPINSVGMVTARDRLTIHSDQDTAWSTVLNFSKLDTEQARKSYHLGKDVQSWRVSWAQDDVRGSGPSKEHLVPVLYRPFDIRWTYYTGKSGGFICRPIVTLMPHMLAGGNIAIISSRQQARSADGWAQVGVTNQITESCAISNITREISYLFPLYLYPGIGGSAVSMFPPWPEGRDGRCPNLDPDFVQTIEQDTGLAFQSDGGGDLSKAFGPEDVVAYIYAIFHCPDYRRRFEPMLKLDFPRVPPVGSHGAFTDLVRLGHEVLSLHLLDSPRLDDHITTLAGSGEFEVEKVSYSDETVWIDKAKTRGFKGVQEEVWNFHIGGYQVCEKWLKDRQAKGGKNPRPGRVLTDEDIEHYQKIVVALSETIRIMGEIDEAIEEHGGWPDAFITE